MSKINWLRKLITFKFVGILQPHEKFIIWLWMRWMNPLKYAGIERDWFCFLWEINTGFKHYTLAYIFGIIFIIYFWYLVLSFDLFLIIDYVDYINELFEEQSTEKCRILEDLILNLLWHKTCISVMICFSVKLWNW